VKFDFILKKKKIKHVCLGTSGLFIPELATEHHMLKHAGSLLALMRGNRINKHAHLVHLSKVQSMLLSVTPPCAAYDKPGKLDA
jgi:hypothetical protein